MRLAVLAAFSDEYKYHIDGHVVISALVASIDLKTDGMYKLTYGCINRQNNAQNEAVLRL